jgi:3-hydroxyisobutyrate dehydrogenase-like beta-hydroxyacid dehydrogenase
VDDAGVEDIVVRQGLLAAMRAGSTLLIHSTVAPATCRRLAAQAESFGVDLLDAPVSGGRAGALRGALSVIVGGSADALARVRPVLEAYGDPIRHVGDVGTAQAVKLVNNALFVANVVMAKAAMELGERLGLESATVTDVLLASSGRSVGLEALAMLTTTEWGQHALGVLRKDVDLLAAVAGELEGERSSLVDVGSAGLGRLR